MAKSRANPALTGLMTVGTAPSFSMGLVYVAMSDSIGRVMGNAATAQMHGQRVSTAGTTMACVQILEKGIAGK